MELMKLNNRMPLTQNSNGFNNRLYNNSINNINNNNLFNQNNVNIINNNIDYSNQKPIQNINSEAYIENNNNKINNLNNINTMNNLISVNNTSNKCTCSKTGCKKKYCACFPEGDSAMDANAKIAKIILGIVPNLLSKIFKKMKKMRIIWKILKHKE